MEFEEIQTIWDTQNHTPMYALNEQALHNRIVAKKRSVMHIASFSEWLIIASFIITGAVTIWISQLYLLAAWMLAGAVYTIIGRIRRLKASRRYDRSMLGDLQHALAGARYQVRLAQIMRWNILPVGAFIVISFWESGKPVWIAVVTAVFLLLTFYASKWELNIYKTKKRELEILLNKLTKE